MTGLDLSDAVLLVQDLIEMQAKNLVEKDRFIGTRKRALFLPHCSRKYMDNRCKAVFDPNIPSYLCAHCSEDCLVNRASSFAEKKAYDVYVLPGGSCIPKILQSKRYEGIVGVSCGEETRLGGQTLSEMGAAGQAVPLIKNGCANTFFNIETLFRILYNMARLIVSVDLAKMCAQLRYFPACESRPKPSDAVDERCARLFSRRESQEGVYLLHCQ